MKVTKRQLKQLIKEELEQVIEENPEVLSEEQLDEGMREKIMAMLQSPEAKEIFQKMIMPMIQQALEKRNAPAAPAPAAAAPAPVAGAPAE